MLRATSVVRKAAVKADRITGTVVLTHEDRQRRRVMLTMVDGSEFLLDLDKATDLNAGDALKLENGNLVLVNAAAQHLLEIRAENPLRLMRVAWHIGNRHTPAEITDSALYIEDDHVLAEMIRGQGCSLTKVTRPFTPERGAYDHGGHDHGAHQEANPAHGEPGHVHGPECGHDHSHDHTHDVLKVGSHEHDHGHDHTHDHKHDHEHKHHHGHDHGHAARAKHDH